jgi:hypothetical protein
MVGGASIVTTGLLSGAVTYWAPRAPDACGEWISTPGLREDTTYHLQSHFWALQIAETGVFLAAAALLAGFCFWWIRHRQG